MAKYSLSVIGAGYVGLVTGVGLASFGHQVRIAEADAHRLGRLERGEIPFYEPGLPDHVTRGLAAGRISFHASNTEAVEGTRAAFVAVPTPPAPNGEADLSIVEKVLIEIAPAMEAGSVIVIKSTVPPGSARRFQSIVDEVATGITVGSNPEFLSQGRALAQFLNPDRVVIGADSDAAQATMMAIYSSVECPLVVTDPTSAELIKYGSNAFLATRISFINGLARLADRVGADIDAVATGMSHDPRIGHGFLRPGPGFGGSCLPKDTSALAAAAVHVGYEFRLLDAVLEINEQQLDYVISLVRERLGTLSGKRIALWGLAFKAGTDDTRESPASKLATMLVAAGAEVRAFDPMVTTAPLGATMSAAPLEAAAGADAVLIATEWPEFAEVDLRELSTAMEGRLVLDARNLLDPEEVRRHGLQYAGVGRGVSI